VSEVLKKLLREGEGEIAIVSHRVLLKVMICTALSIGNSYFWQIKQDVGAISILDYKDGKVSLSLLNDTCHLDKVRQSKEIKDF